MQDIQHIGGGSGGGGGRFFGGGDRRLRPLNHQALKCPRCDSVNTKFCYYNNYNLSQPRHFCKSCRRYWTKGGVLRNVPVGGGCRKAKRSKQRSSAPATGDGARERNSNVQSSSSESSSLTAATTPTSAAAPATEEGCAPSSTTPNSTVFNFADARYVNANPSFSPPLIVNPSTDGQIFSTETFANLMTSPAEMMAFGVADIPTTLGNPAAVPDNPASMIVEELKMQAINDEGLSAALDWGNGDGEGSGDPGGLFDLTAAVDPAYWSQPPWTEGGNQSLDYLP